MLQGLAASANVSPAASATGGGSREEQRGDQLRELSAKHAAVGDGAASETAAAAAAWPCAAASALTRQVGLRRGGDAQLAHVDI